VTDDEILDELRSRRANPDTRIDAATVPTPLIYDPATDQAVADAERALGFALPRFLKRVLTEVGNGGFGPGFGLIGLRGGHPNSDGKSLVDMYLEWQPHGWRERLLPVSDWGCAAWSCVDPEDNVVTADQSRFTLTRFTLPAWLDAWNHGVSLSDETFETGDAIILNPFTRKPMPIKRRTGAKGRRLE